MWANGRALGKSCARKVGFSYSTSQRGVRTSAIRRTWMKSVFNAQTHGHAERAPFHRVKLIRLNADSRQTRLDVQLGQVRRPTGLRVRTPTPDRKSTRLNSSHLGI